jgi:hypothetical protein
MTFLNYSLDIWSNSASATAASRSGVIGYSIVGGICGTNKYSIVEDMGFSNIQVFKN